MANSKRNIYSKPCTFVIPYSACDNFLACNSVAQNCDSESSKKNIMGNNPVICSKTDRVQQEFSESLPLTPHYGLRPTDVTVDRVKFSKNHVGNKNLCHLVASKVEKYATADKKLKSEIISATVEEILRYGRFVKLNPRFGKWVDVDRYKAHNKVAQEFRNALHFRYRSSPKSKKKIRENKKNRLEHIAEACIEQTSSLGQEVSRESEASKPTKQIDDSRANDNTDHFSSEFTSSVVDSFARTDDDFDAKIKLINFDGIPHNF